MGPRFREDDRSVHPLANPTMHDVYDALVFSVFSKDILSQDRPAGVFLPVEEDVA
jgi:hypothetical protein